jgi:hypothetical protein
MLNRKVTYLLPQPHFVGVVNLWTICEDGIQGTE